jgi:hypothetical protein
MPLQSRVRRTTTLAATVALALAGAAAAANLDIVAAEQVAVDTTSNTGVGDAMGPTGQEFAQAFRVDVEGLLTHVMLPIHCLTGAPATIRVTIQGVNSQFGRAMGMPNGRVLASQDVDPLSFDALPSATTGAVGMRMVRFVRPPRLQPGNYAFTVSGIGGVCVIWYGPLGDTYQRGQAYLSTQPGSAPGMPAAWNHIMPRDLAFQVFMQPL